MSVLIIGSRICFGQQDSISKRTSISPKIKVSYISSLVYPGISTGIEFLKKEKAGSNLKIRNQLLTFNLNWYHHPGFHDNIYLTSEWVIRKMKKKGFYSEFSAGPGYSRTFLGGTTYRVEDNGKVSIKKYAGYNYALVTIGGGIGYYFNYMKKVPLSAYAKTLVPQCVFWLKERQQAKYSFYSFMEGQEQAHTFIIQIISATTSKTNTQ